MFKTLERRLTKTVVTLTKQRRVLRECELRADSLARQFISTHHSAAASDGLFRELLTMIGPDAVSETLVRQAAAARVPLSGLASFRRSLSMRSRGRSLTGLSQEWALNNKRVAYRFAAASDVPFPQTFQAGCTLETLSKTTFRRVAVKPERGAGANGVYLVMDPTSIYDVARKEWLSSWDAMISAMKTRLDAGRLTCDSWLVEELILENSQEGTPGRDLKFYCFYGEVGLVLEVRRYNGLKYCEWDGQGQQVFSGKYDRCRFDGEGATPEQLALAANLSAAVPAPFLRLDFLRSDSAPTGMVFGEVTPRPGNFQAFNDELDRILGERFLAAEGRLLNDLVKRKKTFPHYERAVAPTA